MSQLLSTIPFSVLDLVPALEGKEHRQTLENTLAFAQHIEALGYHRLWISEHHNTSGLLSSATVVIMGYLAQGTQSIRIGSGGIMLPNHTPLVVAEQIGTLATLYPNRIDLGLGRAPGTDQLTAMALRRNRRESVEDFPNDIQELQFYLSGRSQSSLVRAIPGECTYVPIYLLGSSTFSAQLAAMLGLPYAFASHFAPTHLFDALKIYKEDFKPSEQIEKPYTLAAVNVILADTEDQAQYIASSGRIFRQDILRNTRRPLQRPVANYSGIGTPMVQEEAKKMSKYNFVGTPDKVKAQLEKFVQQTKVDEIIISSLIYDLHAKKRSFELLASLKS